MSGNGSCRGGPVYRRVGIIVLLGLGIIGGGRGADILYVAPSAAISHYQMMEPLMKALSQRGHNVTVLSHFPQKEKLPNYTDVDLRGSSPPFELDFQPYNLISDALELFAFGQEACEMFATSDVVQNFLKADNKFDLIFIEAFDSDCLLGVVARLRAPFALFSAMAIPVWEGDWIYNPTEAAYVADILCRLWGKMDFYKRLQNVACQLMFRVLNWVQNTRPIVDVVRKHFDLDINSFDELKRNVSLILVNSFHVVTGVRPLLPNVVEVGGIHLKPRKPLPQNIEKFCEKSTGVIVFSMGSIVKGHTLSPTIKAEILSVISSLNVGVIWKWEEEFPDKLDNLLVLPWLPQSDVLGYPKVKVFISHGGIHGVYEAIYNGVPIIGIPLFGDQHGNLKTLESKGAAVVIDFPDLNGKTLSSAINRMLGNDSYKKNAETLSRIFRDQAQTQLDKAVFWTEYVIRHGGAPHLQTGASRLNWLQYLLLDVIFFCVSLIIVLIAVFYYSLKFLRII